MSIRSKKKVLHQEFFRFLVVGGLGTITNLVCFYILADILYCNKYISSTFVFLVAVSQNYILNHRWTFISHKSLPLSWKTYLKFVCVSLAGLGVNLLVLNMADAYLELPLLIYSQALGIISGTLVNFGGSKLFVFALKKENNENITN